MAAVASPHGIGRCPGQASPLPRPLRGSSSTTETGIACTSSPNTARRNLKIKLVRGSTSQSPRRSRGGKPFSKMPSRLSAPAPNGQNTVTTPPVWRWRACGSGVALTAGAAGMARVCRILCYGDSLTAGFCADGKLYQPYGEALSDSLNMGGVASEVGVCGLVGHTAETMVAELHNATAKDISGRPGKGLVRILEDDRPIDLVLLMVGTNDLGKGSHPQDIADDIWSLHNACHTRGVPTISISPPTGIGKKGWPRANRDRLADILAVRLGSRVGADDGVLAHFDVEELLPRILDGTRYWEPDELHLSAAGSTHLGTLLASWILPAVRDAFCPARSSSPPPASSSPTVTARSLCSIRSTTPMSSSRALGSGSSVIRTSSLTAPSAGNMTGRSQVERPLSPKCSQLRRNSSPVNSCAVLGTAGNAGAIIGAASASGKNQVERLKSPKITAPVRSGSPICTAPVLSAVLTTGIVQVERPQSPMSDKRMRSNSPTSNRHGFDIGNIASPIIRVRSVSARSHVERLQSPKSSPLLSSRSQGNHLAPGVGDTLVTPPRSSVGNTSVAAGSASPIISAASTSGKSQVERLQSPKNTAKLRSSSPSGHAPAPSAGFTTGTVQAERLESPRRTSSLTAPSAGNMTGRSQTERPLSPKCGLLKRTSSPLSSRAILSSAGSTGAIISAGSTSGKCQVERSQSPIGTAPKRSSSPSGNAPAPSAGSTTGISQDERPQSPKSSRLMGSNSPASNHRVFGTGSGASPIIDAGSTSGRSHAEMQSLKTSPRPSSSSQGNHPVVGAGSIFGTIRMAATPPTPHVGNTTVRSPAECQQSLKGLPMMRPNTPLSTQHALGAGGPSPKPPLAIVGNISQVECLQSPTNPTIMISTSPVGTQLPLSSATSAAPIISGSTACNPLTIAGGNTTGRGQVESLMSPKHIDERIAAQPKAEETAQVAQPLRSPSQPLYFRRSVPSPGPGRGRRVSPARTEDRMQTGRRCSSLEGQRAARQLQAPSPAVVLRSSLRSPSPSSGARNSMEEMKQTLLNSSSVEIPAAGHSLHAPGQVYVRGLPTESPAKGHSLRPPSPSPRDIRCSVSVNDNDVEVWSKSSGVWCKGAIRWIEGASISVEYALPDGGLSFKRLPCDSPEIKLLKRTTNKTPSKFFGAVAGSMDLLSPAVKIL